MAEEQAAQTLTQVNAEFLNARASRLDNAISAALQGRVEAPKAPKAGKAPASRSSSPAPSPASSTAAATGAAVTPASTASSTPLSTQPASEPSESSGEATQEPSTDEAGAADDAQDGAAEAEQTGLALDRTELEALAKKKDRRGIEKLLGLQEGSLGVGDHEYAAYRRRLGEVEALETKVTQLHEQNNQTLINKFGPAVDAIQLAQKGNLLGFARAIELTTGIRIATFVEHWAKNVQQLDPRVLQLEQENARLRQQGQIVTQDGQVEKPAVTQEAARKKADERIAAEAPDHPALKLRGGKDEVRSKWLGSFDPVSRSFKLTPAQAADAVVEDRRKAREQEDWVLSGKRPPKKPVTRAVSRTGASESQPRKNNLTREQIIEQHAKLIRQAKAADRR